MLTGRKAWIFVAFGVFLAWSPAPAEAQLLGGIAVPGVGGGLGLPPIGGTPTLPIPSLPSVGNIGNLQPLSPFIPMDSVGRPLDQKVISIDALGQPIVRGEILAIAPTDTDLDIARGL